LYAGTERTTKKLSQNKPCPIRDSNRAPPECKSKRFTATPALSFLSLIFLLFLPFFFVTLLELIFVLFNGASIKQHEFYTVELCDDDELEEMWKEAAVVYFKEFMSIYLTSRPVFECGSFQVRSNNTSYGLPRFLAECEN
jgi:hypothetical protein